MGAVSRWKRRFESAEREVLVAGYTFDHGAQILGTLHAAMAQRRVRALVFLDVGGLAANGGDIGAFAARKIDEFLAKNWPFGAPFPEIYFDPRTVSPSERASLHAKCVVADEARTHHLRQLHRSRAGAEYRGGRADRRRRLCATPRNALAYARIEQAGESVRRAVGPGHAA